MPVPAFCFLVLVRLHIAGLLLGQEELEGRTLRVCFSSLFFTLVRKNNEGVLLEFVLLETLDELHEVVLQLGHEEHSGFALVRQVGRSGFAPL